MLRVLSQPIQNVTQLGGHHLMCLCLKITSSHTCFLPPWIPIRPVLFSPALTIFLHIFSFPVFHFLAPPLCLPPHAFILLSACFEEHMLYLSIKTQYGFHWGQLQKKHIKIDMYIACCWQLRFERRYFYYQQRQLQLKRTHIKQRCTCGDIAHNLF